MDRGTHTQNAPLVGPKGRPIRVAMLFAYFPPDYTGAGIQGRLLATRLVARGVDVQVLGPLHAEVDAPREENFEGVRIRRFSIPRFDFTRKFSLGLKTALWLMFHADWDLLHVHGFGYFAILPSFVSRLRGRPVVVKTTLSGADHAPKPDGRPHHRLIVEAYRRVDAVVALSEELEAGFRDDPAFRCEVLRLPNGVDAQHFTPPATQASRRAARQHLQIDPDDFVVMAAGRLDHRKRVVDLVKAAGRSTLRPITVLLAGPESPFPEDGPALAAAAEMLPEGVRVQRLGEVSHADLVEVYRAADAFVLASSSEGMPNSLLEAMAAGLPCLASDIPGSRDVLARGGGRLFAVGDVAALAAEIDALGNDREAARALGAEARARVQADYSVESVCSRYIDLYASLLGWEPPGDR